MNDFEGWEEGEEEDWEEIDQQLPVIKLEEVGQSIMAYYQGYREITTENGTSRLHKLVEPAAGDMEETAWGMWGSIHLDRLLEEVPVGKLIKITRIDDIKTKNKRRLKAFRVQMRKGRQPWAKRTPDKEPAQPSDNDDALPHEYTKDEACPSKGR